MENRNLESLVRVFELFLFLVCTNQAIENFLWKWYHYHINISGYQLLFPSTKYNLFVHNVALVRAPPFQWYTEPTILINSLYHTLAEMKKNFSKHLTSARFWKVTKLQLLCSTCNQSYRSCSKVRQHQSITFRPACFAAYSKEKQREEGSLPNFPFIGRIL